jgi:hypothetical protein
LFRTGVERCSIHYKQVTREADQSLDNAVEQLIVTYGREAVRNRTVALTRPPLGRRRVGHWKLLWPEMLKDATKWLSGAKRESNRAIAKRVAEKHPGQSEESTFRQLQAKMGQERETRMLHAALVLTSGDPEALAKAEIKAIEYPFAVHFRVLEDLAARDPAWGGWLKQDQLTLKRYRQLAGNPDPSMTWSELRRRATNGLLGRALPREKKSAN